MISTVTKPFLALLGLVLALMLTGCGGDDDGAADTSSPADALAAAKAAFDEASSVHLTLSTDAKPSSGNGVLGADGVLTHQPAFEGEVEVVLGGLQAKVPVVAVDGKLHAKLPLTSSYATIDPGEYGAPDPAQFADPETGISSLLTELDGVERTGQQREGDQILTTYTGTLSGDQVKPIIPSAAADGTFDAEIGIDADGRVATLTATGPFFSGQDDVAFDLTLDSYGEDVEITAP